MKKMSAVLSMGLLVVFCSFAYAQENVGRVADKGMMKNSMMEGKGMMMQGKKMGMHPMGGMMMPAMMQKSIVATEDGGVIVLVGNKLIKYDKDLNFVKEVEIKIDTEAMKKFMEEMMKNCPMMQGGMKMDAEQPDIMPPDSASQEETDKK